MSTSMPDPSTNPVMVCGCGKPTRYETINGMACNKYFRCRDFPITDGGTYPEWTEEDKAKLREALEQIFGPLQQKDT